MLPVAIAAALSSSADLVPARLRTLVPLPREHGGTRDHRLEEAQRRGVLALGSVEKPLGEDDLLQLFELLRHCVEAESAMTIRLTALPGVLGSLADVLAKADGRHGVVVDLLWEEVAREAVWDDLVRLSVRGLFVRLVFRNAPADRDWEPWVQRARAFGAADVALDSRLGGEAVERLDRWRLTYGLPQVPVGRG